MKLKGLTDKSVKRVAKATKTREDILSMAQSNAEMAIDQAYEPDFEDLQDAIDSYYENAADTMAEWGFTVSDREWDLMYDEYFATVERLRGDQ